MAEKLKDVIEKTLQKSPEEIKKELPGLLQEFKNATLDDALGAVSELGGIKGLLGKIGSVDRINEVGRAVKDIMPQIIPTINEIIQNNIKSNPDLAKAFEKIKSAKVTAGMDLVDMGIGIKAKFDSGMMTVENGLDGADMTLVLPTQTLLDLYPQLASGKMSDIMKVFTGGKLKIKGAMMKGAAILPLFTELGKMGKK
ncbi:MAG TPA: SCP2 sterol-binding domain-containing protein [Halobacteria archaeon]|jgi:putative sterol carrier protein|nr:SCP2 sterol-binding domain-containing protein [Halobacteria archaeon]